ncbi:MAG: tyrosine-type recombinase/integrase, partial [Desulfobacterales bacterium]|nr:tyrosine-type recombinase/integrase [Desulfobacterales bacterium]
TTELALRWATQPKDCQPVWQAVRLGMVRRFANYRSAMDPRTEIPAQELLPSRYHRRPPCIYNDDEITSLIKAAQKLRSPIGLRVSTYSTLFGLLAVTGMRISEPIGLNREDVNLTEGILTIRQTKFGKSRLVPIHPSTQEALRQYAILRDQTRPQPKTPGFFVSERGTRLTQCSVRRTFVQLSRQIGLRGPHDSHGPRLHDLRHRFAIRTLVAWYRAGIDIERHMPELSTYLGHRHVTDTYWYISAVPELLRLATLRLTEGGKL